MRFLYNGPEDHGTPLKIDAGFLSAHMTPLVYPSIRQADAEATSPLVIPFVAGKAFTIDHGASAHHDVVCQWCCTHRDFQVLSREAGGTRAGAGNSR